MVRGIPRLPSAPAREHRGVTPVFSTVLLIAVAVMFATMVAVFVFGLLPGPREIAMDSEVTSWEESEDTQKMVIKFRHAGGETVALEDLRITMSGTDLNGEHRTYSSDEFGEVDMKIYEPGSSEPSGKTTFEIGDRLEVTFTFSDSTYLLDPTEDPELYLVYKPTGQVLVKSTELEGEVIPVELVYDDFDDGKLGTEHGGKAGGLSKGVEISKISGYKDFFDELWSVNLIFDIPGKEGGVLIDDMEFVKLPTLILPYDYFDDGELDTIWGGKAGAMSPGGQEDPELNIIWDSDLNSKVLSITFDFSGSWCGYYSFFYVDESGCDVSSYLNLEMRVKGAAGGEKFKVELKDTGCLLYTSPSPRD